MGSAMEIWNEPTERTIQNFQENEMCLYSNFTNTIEKKSALLKIHWALRNVVVFLNVEILNLF